MDDYLIEIYLPYTGKIYDIAVPSDIIIADAIELISSALEKLTDGVYRFSRDAVLCDKESNSILDINKKAFELGIRNGTRLILI